MTAVPIITIDGPSGTGKGTACARIAKHFGWHMLDSGALYRLLALAASRHSVALTDEPGLVALASNLNVEFSPIKGQSSPSARLEGETVSQAIRTEACGRAASQIAALAQVREALLSRQRDFAQPPGLVTDGRDMGTVVFPDAKIKVFLDASAQVRAMRRWQQLKQHGNTLSLESVLAELVERDNRDIERACAPLKPATDAEIIDTSGLTIEQVVDRIVQYAQAHLIEPRN